MTNNQIKNWCLVLALAASSPVFAASSEAQSATPVMQQQTGTCTGVVYDETGEPLMGATVKVEGAQNATATNIDGEFSLTNVKPGSKITVSFIGYKPMTVVWNGQPLSINMNEDANVLDEVVVMGYGVEQKRAKVTNSIAKVSEKTLTVGTNANPAQALVGAVSGVRVNVTSGSPSATPNIVIRGGANFSGDASNNQPLFVVDGQIRDALSDINPNDIESMEILKDAGATALYGARAGNGVVLITTKKGKAGTGKVNFSAKFGINNYNNQGYDVCSDEDFLYYFRTGKASSQWALPGGGYASQYNGLFTGTNGPGDIGRTEYNPLQNYNVLRKTDDNAYLLDNGWREMADPLSDNYILYKPTDILKYNLNRPAYTQDYNVNFSGGNDRGNYYAALGYYDADGAVKGTFYKRYNFAFTGSYKINDWLTSNSVFNYIRSNWLNDDPLIGTAYMMNRGTFWKFVNFEAEDGTPLYGNNGPVNVNVNRGNFNRKYQSDKFQMTQAFTAKIIDGLTLKGTMSWYYNEQVNDWSNLAYATSNTGAWNMYHKTGNSGVNRTYGAGNSFLRYFDQTYNLVANFNRTFAEKHTINAMLGTEFYKRKYISFDASGTGAPLPGYPDLSLTSQDTRDIDSSHANEALMSYFGRVEYDYMDKYLAAVTFREDGYSRLINNRWGFFPGASLGWVFTKEDFWKDNDSLSWLNYGKLRASFGLNATINSSYLGYYSLRGSYSSWMYDGNTGYRIGSLPNPDLKWERTRTAEVGLDLGFLNNRFNLGLTYYNRLTMDKYANKSLPQTTGFSSIIDNNGSYENQGLEIDLNATFIRTRDFSWSFGANLTYNSNKIKKLPYSGLENNRVINTGVEVYTGNGDETHYIAGYQEGINPYQQVGYGVRHMVRSQADIDALGDYIDVVNPNNNVYATEAGRQRLIAMGVASTNMIRLQPGSFVYEDINGDNKIDTKDRRIIGHSDPHWSGGFNTTFTWKGLSLYARFDMGFGFQVYDSNLTFWLAEGQGAMAFPSQVTDTWTPDNPGAKYPRVVWADQYGCDSYIRTNSFFAQSGAYLACRELSLSYTLPENICKKIHSQGLSFSVTGQNLGYIKSCTIPLPDNTTYWSGSTAGDGGTYNLPRTVIFGLNVTF